MTQSAHLDFAERALKDSLLSKYPELRAQPVMLDSIAVALERGAPGIGAALHERGLSATSFAEFADGPAITANHPRRIVFFRSGTHTATDGQARNFPPALLADAAAAYDPSAHEAPVVIGHPDTNKPAYGWVRGITFQNGEVSADIEDVHPAFADAVKSGAYKKVSASWYLPESPGNPKPGKLYLRHIGFLGAAAPAIKGLPDVQFAEVATHTDRTAGHTAGIRRLIDALAA